VATSKCKCATHERDIKLLRDRIKDLEHAVQKAEYKIDDLEHEVLRTRDGLRLAATAGMDLQKQLHLFACQANETLKTNGGLYISGFNKA